ncbi:MAG: 3-deoxy-manno-octulosonate cytidylyltransferase [Pseudomonadota bacterium]
MKTLIVIPARYGSTRLPGKPLAMIAGRTMLSRVIHVAQAAGHAAGADVVVATDDERIKTHAEEQGTAAVMTDAALPSGTDRARAALHALNSEADFIVNLQGDAPFTPPSHILALIRAGETTDADVATIVTPLSWAALDALREAKTTTPFSGTTCIRAEDGRALWFSKTILPAIRKEDRLRAEADTSPVLQHVGLYGYRRAALDRFSALPPSLYEQLEGLEQLRFLENGMSIHAEVVDPPTIQSAGVDSAEDLARAEALIAKHGDPHG